MQEAVALRLTSEVLSTFELTGPRRRDALVRTERMHSVLQAGPRWPAVAGPVERGVRPHRADWRSG